MTLVREAHEARERVPADPVGRLSVRKRLADLLDLRLMRRRRPADHLVASEARLERRNPGFARDGHCAVTVQAGDPVLTGVRSEEHTSELQSLAYLVCRLLLEKKKKLQTKPLSREMPLSHLHCA